MSKPSGASRIPKLGSKLPQIKSIKTPTSLPVNYHHSPLSKDRTFTTRLCSDNHDDHNSNRIIRRTLTLDESVQNIFSCSGFTSAPISHSTPINDDSRTKRGSCEESLGILTPNEMNDAGTSHFLFTSRTPSSECINGIHETKLKRVTNTDPTSPLTGNYESPNYSLGILDDELIGNLTVYNNTMDMSALLVTRSDTTINMELPLDRCDRTKEIDRLEQTPSPEDLPLDPIPIVESGDSKSESSKSKNTTNCYVNMLTSITSLDTGYQGDGEMSRPASRGAENQTFIRRPIVRPHKNDPMTDSDFYTESEADNHEECSSRGDRRAQVIDGTLYGVDAQTAAAIYANNRETMDSSGIFTDIESTAPADNVLLIENNDISPSDTSTKTLSQNSQKKEPKLNADTEEVTQTNTKKRMANSPAISSPSSVRSPKHSTLKNDTKKFKIAKRDVKSNADNNNETKKILKKPAGRWDSVMNKISKGEQNKPNLKDIKSKVYNGLAGNSATKSKDAITKNGPRIGSNLNTKPRRVPGCATKTTYSSNSDLSAATIPPKKPLSVEKKRDSVQQVLTASKLTSSASTRLTHNGNESKKSLILTPNKPKKKLFSSVPKEKKPATVKDCTRVNAKGGRTSPVVRPPVPTNRPQKPSPAPKVAEALAVLVQHLVFDVEAFQVPILRRQLEKERLHHKNQIDDLIEQHKNELQRLTNQHADFEARSAKEYEHERNRLLKQDEERLIKLKKEFEKLQKTHEESLEILREENDAIREQIDEKNLKIQNIENESVKMRGEFEGKIGKLNEQIVNGNKENHKLRNAIEQVEQRVKDQVRNIYEENARLREENDRLLSYGDDKGVSMQEVQSLRAVLDLKQNEVAELRRALAESSQKNEILAGIEEKAAILNARCEDLELQLKRKSEYEQNLIAENKKLNESIKEETNQKKRLCQYNEELQWKLRQNKEVVNKVLEQTENSVFNRTWLSASFSERYCGTSPRASNGIERTFSFRERPATLRHASIDTSPPTSPKVKGVVEKSDSVSYVLDLDESPDVVASRIVRRSFRNTTTPPKSTPTKSPANKRPRRRPSSGGPSPDPDDAVFVGEHIDLDEDDDDEVVDVKLPALPSEIGNGRETLPCPKRLATDEDGDGRRSVSTSEDESTSSSSNQL